MTKHDESAIGRMETRLMAWVERPAIKTSLVWLQRLLTVTVVVYLFWKLGTIGWTEVLAAIPTSPWFYALFLAMFLALPASEVLIYNRIWRVSQWPAFGTYLIKRVLNFGVVSYSGEAYFFGWAKQRPELSGKSVMSAVKDVNILSGLSSNVCTVLMLAVFFALGYRDVLEATGLSMRGPVLIFVVLSLVLIGVVVRFHRHVLALAPRDTIWVLGLHSVRLIGIMLLQAAQWAIVFPAVGFATWFFFLTLQLIVTRIPFLPNKELVFMGASLSLLAGVDAPEAAVAAMFLASGALSQVANVVIVVVFAGAKTLRGTSRAVAS